jgi:uncharacterized membrane protein YkoI
MLISIVGWLCPVTGVPVIVDPSKTEESMRTFLTQLSVIMVAGLLSLGGVVQADEEKVPLDKVPKTVMAAVKAKFPDAEPKGASREKENGKIIYEVTIKNKGQNIDVELSEDGKILAIEKEINVKDLPKKVAEALEAKYPKATHKKAEEIIKVENGVEKPAVFEVVLVTTDKKSFEVVVSADGKIQKEEGKEEKK